MPTESLQIVATLFLESDTPGAPMQIRLSEGTHPFGSSPDSLVVLNCMNVAPEHGEFVIDGSQAFVCPLNDNTIWVNGEPAIVKTELNADDEIKIGDASFIIQKTNESGTESVTTSAVENAMTEREKFEAEQKQFREELAAFQKQQEDFRRASEIRNQQLDAWEAELKESGEDGTPNESDAAIQEELVRELAAQKAELDRYAAELERRTAEIENRAKEVETAECVAYERQEETPAAPEPTPETEPAPEPVVLRSELADLFGIDPNAVQAKPEPATTQPAEDIKPEPAPEPEPEPQATQPAPEPTLPADIESDDYMESYMASLLARSRNTPSEPAPAPAPKPKPTAKPVQSEPAAKPEAKATPEPAAFTSYEAYKQMANGETPTEAPVAEDPVAESIEAEPAARTVNRPRIDKNEARARLSSLREVASKSAQAAVASHAWKKNRPQVVIQTGVMLTGFIVGGILLTAHTMELINAYEIAALFFGLGLVGASMLLRRMQMIRRMKIKAYEEATRVVKSAPEKQAPAQPENQSTFVLADIENYINE